jgi:predicted O-methyltransferase YrrM
MSKKIFKQVDQYISRLLVPQDPALDDVERSIKEANMPQISISAAQGKFLEVLARVCQAKKILELGTLGGYSTIWLARALPSNGKLISLELEQVHAEVAKKNISRAGLSQLVEIRVGKALDLLPLIEQEGIAPFDMIFIDADKPPYTEYFQWALRLSRPGTLIVADNVIRDGKVLDKHSQDESVKGMQRFNHSLAENKAVTAAILQTVGAKDHDGMAFAVVN